MNKFEAVQQFRASLQAANVPQQQRGALVRAFNAALSTTPDPDAADYILALTQKRDWLNWTGCTALLGSAGVCISIMLNHTTNASGADLGLFTAACFGAGFGAGKLLTVLDMTAIMREVNATVGAWFDDEPDPEPPREPVVRFDPVAPRHLRRMYYDWRREDLERLDRLRIGEPVTRTRLSQLDFPGLTSASQHRPGKYVYNDLIDDMIAKGWIDDDGRWAGRG